MSENEKKLKREKTIKKLRDIRDKFTFGDLKEEMDGKDRKGLSPSTGSSPSTPSTPSTGSSPKRKSESLPTTVEQALADGWTMGRAAGMSDPPVYSFTKDGKTISIRGEKTRRKPGLFSPLKKQKGGVIKRRGGGIAKRGFGISK